MINEYERSTGSKRIECYAHKTKERGERQGMEPDLDFLEDGENETPLSSFLEASHIFLARVISPPVADCEHAAIESPSSLRGSCPVP